MKWHCVLINLSLLTLLAFLLVNPAASMGNTTSGIYPGTTTTVCVGDTIFVGETGLNLTPLTPYASGVVTALQSAASPAFSLPVSQSTSFNVGSVSPYFGTYYPVVNGQVLTGYPVQIQPFNYSYPVNVVITSSKAWVIANNTDSALITVTVTNLNNAPLPGVSLSLSANAPWGLQDAALTTDSNGQVETLFLPTTTSGAAVITATATVPGVTTAPVTNSFIQNIDATNPFRATPVYPGTATVGSPVNILVQVTDKYGNPVTSNRVLTNVTFSGAPGVFLDASGNRLTTLSAPLNGTGWADVTYLVSTTTTPPDNFIAIVPPAPISSALIDIVGIGNSIPFSILQVVSPAGNPPMIPADGNSQATINYFLYDQWGNPAVDQAIQIVTSVGENKIFYTNNAGQVTVLYGPKFTAGFYSLTATAALNSSVVAAQTLQFGSTTPANMILTASPQTMASLDVNPGMVANVIAKVIDVNGNPVQGQNVTFTLQSANNNTYVETQGPAIGSGGVNTSVISAPVFVVTNQNGQAILNFYPGAFPIPGTAFYNQTAQATAIVNASWTGPNGTVSNTIQLTYENYPFVSVYTNVNPETVQTGGLVDVSVQLQGNGWALQPKPLDVVLCIDRSGSMLENSSIENGVFVQESLNDRIVDARNAANLFVSETGNNDRVGVVSFGAPTNGIALLFNTSPNATVKTLFLSGANGVDKSAWEAGPDYNCTVGQACSDNLNRDNNTDKRAWIMSTYPGHGATGKNYTSTTLSPNYGPVPATYPGYVYVESPLVFSQAQQTQLTKAMDSIVPAGGTPTRDGIYQAVQMIINDPLSANRFQQGAIRAIILETDGAWGVTGDPEGVNTTSFNGPDSLAGVPAGALGPGTGSVLQYAKQNNISVYTIAIAGSTPSDQPNIAQLQQYAAETGGQAYQAYCNGQTGNNCGSQLASIYTQIAGQLQEQASVNTSVALDLSSVRVNNATLPGTQVFNYTYISGRSTVINTGNSTVPQFNGYPMNIDNANDWNSSQMFNFSAGTIMLNQTWTVNFTLMALQAGNIEVFNSTTSQVTFSGIGGEVNIPDTYLTAIPAGTEAGPQNVLFDIQNLNLTNPGDTQVAQLQWDPVYTGNNTNITWEIWLAPSNSNAFQFKSIFSTPRAQDPVTDSISISNLQPGAYTIMVKGDHPSDVNSDVEKYIVMTIGSSGSPAKILIQ